MPVLASLVQLMVRKGTRRLRWMSPLSDEPWIAKRYL